MDLLIIGALLLVIMIVWGMLYKIIKEQDELEDYGSKEKEGF
ncbi:hypothetical protein [Cytobacillus horneckiae]|nr:hypothetical protein [Cytobacillus horneckiae]MEC1158731.1 hypothetical protein [Cytobacillus horneckiae]